MSDEHFMKIALAYAELSASIGEVPVGAVIVSGKEVIVASHNTKELSCNPIGHAEMNAIEEASKKLGRWRLNDCTLYSTLEPCIMCTGALIQARIKRLVYATPDPKFGAIESLYSLSNDQRLNHRFSTLSGVLVEESRRLLKRFFRELRPHQRINSPIV